MLFGSNVLVSLSQQIKLLLHSWHLFAYIHQLDSVAVERPHPNTLLPLCSQSGQSFSYGKTGPIGSILAHAQDPPMNRVSCFWLIRMACKSDHSTVFRHLPRPSQPRQQTSSPGPCRAGSPSPQLRSGPASPSITCRRHAASVQLP